MFKIVIVLESYFSIDLSNLLNFGLFFSNYNKCLYDKERNQEKFTFDRVCP